MSFTENLLSLITLTGSCSTPQLSLTYEIKGFSVFEQIVCSDTGFVRACSSFIKSKRDGAVAAREQDGRWRAIKQSQQQALGELHAQTRLVYVSCIFMGGFQD